MYVYTERTFIRIDKHTYRQTKDIHTNRQRTNKQTKDNKHTYRQTKDIHTNRQTCMQIDRQTYIHTNRQRTDRQSNIHTYRQRIDRQAYRQIDKYAYGQTQDRWTDRQEDERQRKKPGLLSKGWIQRLEGGLRSFKGKGIRMETRRRHGYRRKGTRVRTLPNASDGLPDKF